MTQDVPRTRKGRARKGKQRRGGERDVHGKRKAGERTLTRRHTHQALPCIMECRYTEFGCTRRFDSTDYWSFRRHMQRCTFRPGANAVSLRTGAAKERTEHEGIDRAPKRMRLFASPAPEPDDENGLEGVVQEIGIEDDFNPHTAIPEAQGTPECYNSGYEVAGQGSGERQEQSAADEEAAADKTDALAILLQSLQGRVLSERHANKLLSVILNPYFDATRCRNTFRDMASLRNHVETSERLQIEGAGFQERYILSAEGNVTGSVWVKDACKVLLSQLRQAQEGDITIHGRKE